MVISFILACHCVAHRTNLVALDAAKTSDCNILSIEIDVLINPLSSFFHKLNRRRHAFNDLARSFV